jgi:hypothetical protein
MTANRIRWISTCDFEGGLGVVQVSRGEVQEYLPSEASVRRLNEACCAVVNLGRGILFPDPLNSLAWQLCVYSKDLWPKNCLI